MQPGGDPAGLLSRLRIRLLASCYFCSLLFCPRATFEPSTLPNPCLAPETSVAAPPGRFLPGACGVCYTFGVVMASKRERLLREAGWSWHRWRKTVDRFMRRHPNCNVEGCRNAGEELDHVQPLRLRPDLFLDSSNWQSLCRRHHEEKTLKEAVEARPRKPMAASWRRLLKEWQESDR